MSEPIYLSPPHLNGEEENAVADVLKSNWIAPVGPHLEEWEQAICNLVDTTACCLLNSATAAIHLALKVLDIGPGDLVFIQSHTHIGSVNPIIYQGGIPVFIDSEPGTWNMSAQHLEKAIQEALKGELVIKDKSIRGPFKPKCIIPVHLYGMPADMSAINEIARRYKLEVIEDAAESLGSMYQGSHTGSLSKLGVFSFNGNKIITTGGGGALVGNDRDLVSRAAFYATQARDDAPHFQHSHVGYNYRMSNVLAGLGMAQMNSLKDRVQSRRDNFKRYREYFDKWNAQGFNIQFQEEPEGSYSNRWLTCIVVEPTSNKGLTRETLRLALEENSIESRPLWKPMHLQPVFKNYPYFGENQCEKLFENGLCLPSGSALGNEDFDRIFTVLDGCFKDAKT